MSPPEPRPQQMDRMGSCFFVSPASELTTHTMCLLGRASKVPVPCLQRRLGDQASGFCLEETKPFYLFFKRERESRSGRRAEGEGKRIFSGLHAQGTWIAQGTCVAQSLEHPTSARVTISQFMSSSLASGSMLTAQSLEPASDSVSPSLSAPPLLTHCLSLSLKSK